jgi:hypothetical protein
MTLRARIAFGIAEALAVVAGMAMFGAHVIGGGIFIGLAMFLCYVEGRYVERNAGRLSR